MTKEQAWQEWWMRWPGCIARDELKQAFEAGYDARRAEEAGLDNSPRPKTNVGNHRHRDNQDGTGPCLDCGQSHSHTDPPLPYEHTE